MPFAVTVDTPLPPAAAWARVTDWPAHGRHVPLTSVRATEGGFVARTGLGRFGFDDPMEIVAWDPPRSCRIEKRGSVVLGWAELSVEPLGTGARVTWREEALPARLPRFARGLATAAGGRLFGRVLHRLLS
jgi:polyketide cyclase/dehydrase/lipid transport protein